MVKTRPDGWTIALLVVILALGIFGIIDRRQRAAERTSDLQRQCLSIENIKAGIREQAQATVDGDIALLAAHDADPKLVPLPVPRAAVLADIKAKQRTVDRYPPLPC